MPDEIPPLSLGLGDNDENLVLIDTEVETAPGEAANMAELLQHLPALASEAHAVDLARAANHFKHGTDYRVIENPTEFANAYRAQIEREDPAGEWQEGVVRLRDYGVPDFSQIQPPKLAGGHLTFYATDSFLGLPYKVEAATLEAVPDYTPLPLTPLPQPPVPAQVAAPALAEEESEEEPSAADEPPPVKEDRRASEDSPEAWRASGSGEEDDEA